jgi:hypothetical protein
MEEGLHWCGRSDRDSQPKAMGIMKESHYFPTLIAALHLRISAFRIGANLVKKAYVLV